MDTKIVVFIAGMVVGIVVISAQFYASIFCV